MLQSILKTLARKGYTINTRTNEINLVGVRTNNPKANSFDDTIHLFLKNKNGEWKLYSFPATTDPGTYWLKTFMNPKGTAILKPGQYMNAYRIGVHRGKYQALVQQRPVTVYRDTNKDDLLDTTNMKQETGIFGINIHRASVKGKSVYVDKHSAGCQVLADHIDFIRLMAYAFQHKELYGNNFTYTLLLQSDLDQ